jgi:hypothetical protein
MATTKWGIRNLNRKLPDSLSYPGGEVVAVHWIAYLTEGKHTVNTSGVVDLSPASQKDWVPYQHIDKETAVGWCRDALGADKVKAIEVDLSSRLQELLHPTHELGLPWKVPDPLPPLPYSLGYVTPKNKLI